MNILVIDDQRLNAMLGNNKQGSLLELVNRAMPMHVIACLDYVVYVDTVRENYQFLKSRDEKLKTKTSYPLNALNAHLAHIAFHHPSNFDKRPMP